MGNTRAVAEAIAEGVRRAAPHAEVTCGRAVPDGQLDVDLLIVGAPTHFFGLPRARTRTMWVSGQDNARRRGGAALPIEPGAAATGIREWLDSLPPVTGRHAAAAFDTHLEKALSGGAAPRIARRLGRLGYTLALPPEGFIVEDMAGPLRTGELQRARDWGARLASELEHTSPTPA
jgi:hypothetical protein